MPEGVIYVASSVYFLCVCAFATTLLADYNERCRVSSVYVFCIHIRMDFYNKFIVPFSNNVCVCVCKSNIPNLYNTIRAQNNLLNIQIDNLFVHMYRMNKARSATAYRTHTIYALFILRPFQFDVNFILPPTASCV